MTDRPTLDLDLYSREAIQHPQAAYSAIRSAGRAVWLAKHRMWAMGRYDDVRSALRDDTTFRSGEGVAVNPVTNRLARHTALFSDGTTHVARRKVLMQSLAAKALAPIRGTLAHEAEASVDELLRTTDFDGIADFASRLPLRVVADLVGLNVDKDLLLRWGRSSFDGLGPVNRRSIGAAPNALRLLFYSARLTRSKVKPDGWAATVFDAADRGDISRIEAHTMIIDFVAPALDTTILATGQLLWSLGRTPGAWDRIRDDPALIPAAVVEAVRLSSPVRGFTRTIASDTEIDGVQLKRGQRVALLFAAANMDDAKYPDPELFDLDRRDGGNLGWGYGQHACVGMHLAKLEMQAILTAMVPRVESISVSSPQPLTNNTLQGFESFRATFA